MCAAKSTMVGPRKAVDYTPAVIGTAKATHQFISG
jgi:hypothetical protein